MNSYIIFRIGIPHPTREEVELIMRISEGIPAGAPIFPGGEGMSGVMSVIKSKLTAEEISQEFQKISTGADYQGEDSNVMPVMVFKVDQSNFSYTRDMDSFLGWGEVFRDKLGVQVAGEPQECRLGLDELLDLVKQKGGFNNLTTEEQSRLKKLSQ